MRFFDSHSHLNDEKFNEDRKEIIEKIKENKVEKCIVAGYSLESSKKAIELFKEENFIHFVLGISPNDIPQTMEELLKEIGEIEEMVKDLKKEKPNKVVGIGEIGLDYYWEKDEKMKKLQREAFIKQIELANKLKLPIVIHTRDAMVDTIKILKENEVKLKGVFHCCPQNMELIKEALNLGFYISFAGPITFKNSKNADEIIKMVPIEKLLIETDSPYLAPEPVRGTRNDPSNVRYIAEKIAKVKNMTLEEVSEITFSNASDLFWDAPKKDH